jgi:sugar phosphate isomerase/epimerase
MIMSRLKTAVRLLSLATEPREGFLRAARLGAQGVEIDASGGLKPRELSSTGRRELRTVAAGYQLKIAAVRAPLKRGLVCPEGMEARLEFLEAAIGLAVDIGAKVVVIEAGQVPDKPESPGGRALSASLTHLAPVAEKCGVAIALVTGLESAEVLVAALASYPAEVMGAALDPANWMVHGFDPCQELEHLAGRVRHVHARDARRSSPSRAALDIPLGEGDVPWPVLLAHLSVFGYEGYITIEDASSEPQAEAMAIAMPVLRNWLAAGRGM